jgi:MoaA/NifB/PqqE/SkfB family radical SAM enzyme
MLKNIELNLTELCNMKCGFCPRGSIHNPYPNQNLHMSLDTVKLIVKQAKELKESNRHYSSFVFVIAGRGEPTLHPEFDKIINIITDNKFKIQLFTNGYRFDRYKSSIEKCFFIQYDLYSEKDEDFLDSILKLKDLKSKYKRIHVKTEEGVVKHEWFNNEYVLNVAENFLENRAGAVQEKYNDKLNFKRSKFCKYIEERLFIDWNGNYNLCCMDWSTKSLGNIYRQDIKTYIEQNEYLQAYKNGIRSGKRLSPCDVCTI